MYLFYLQLFYSSMYWYVS